MQVTITLAMLRKLEQEGSLHIEQASSDITIPNTILELVLLKPENVATGAEIKDFWDNGWDGNYYHDDWDEPVQDDMGNWILEDRALIRSPFKFRERWRTRGSRTRALTIAQHQSRFIGGSHVWIWKSKEQASAVEA